jgi:hypothetical protein
MSFYDYDPDAMITCPDCGYTGRAGAGQEVLSDGYEICCVRCDKRLGFVDGHVTLDQTREAAAAGNPRAQASLSFMEKREDRLELAEEVKLKSYKDLPDLDGDKIRIEYDMEAGLGSLSPYDLRHTCASLLAAAGWNHLEIARQLGHSAETSVRVYQHLLEIGDGERRSIDVWITEAREQVRAEALATG